MKRTDKSKGKFSENKGKKKEGSLERKRVGKRNESFSKVDSTVIKKTPNKASSSNKDEMRLNKYIANSGVCSRRDADIYITSGNVTVNGKVINEMGFKVKLTDEVRFDGRRLNPEKIEYILLNKPKGFATTSVQEKGKNTVMGLLANATKSRITPVDKLDRQSTGLLLCTNDGELTKKLTNPKYENRKIYHVGLDKALSHDDLKKIEKGVMIDHEIIKVEDISYVEGASKHEVGVKLNSNRVRVIRNLFEHLGYQVEKLDRVVYAGLTKKDLPRSHWRHLTEQEVINLKIM
jgi:23S rRNA pseudouridine2605 synthase